MRRPPWSDADIELLRRNFSDSRTDDIAATLGRSYSSVAQKARLLGLEKSAAYLASPDACRLRHGDQIGAAFRFKPGQTAWNKGLKGVVGVQDACRATQFKKGRAPEEAANYLPIGSTRICRDGYLERKVTDDPSVVPARRWVGVHRLVWIAAHGPVPDGGVIVFRTGRRTTVEADITADAVELVTRQELMRRNTYHRYGPEIASAIQLRGAIQRQINKRAKEAATS